MRRCFAQPIQPPLTVKDQAAGHGLRVDSAVVQHVRDCDHDLEQEDELYLRQSLEGHSATQ